MCRASETIAFGIASIKFPNAPGPFLHGMADLIDKGICEMLRLTHARMMELDKGYAVLANIQTTGNETWQATNEIHCMIADKYLGGYHCILTSGMKKIIRDGIDYARVRAQNGIKALDKLGKLPENVVSLDLPAALLFGLMMSQEREPGKLALIEGEPILMVENELFMWNDDLKGYWSVAGNVRQLSEAMYLQANGESVNE